MTGFPSIEHLCTEYLNQDWPDEYGDVWAAVDAFVNEEPATARTLPAEVERLLSESPGEEQLDLLFTTDMRCAYSPSASGSTYRSWLQEVAQRVARLVPEPGAESLDHDEGGEA